MLIACCYRQSPIFTPDYLKVFAGVFSRYHSDKKLVCFTDYKKALPKNIEKIPLQHSWSTTWFSKLELFRPDITEDIFYIDLDNLILQPLDEFFERFDSESPWMIEDLDPKKTRLQSAVMWIPHSKKHLVWDPLIKNPVKFTTNAGKFGDAEIIRSFWTRDNGTRIFQYEFNKYCIASFHLQWRGLTPEQQKNVKILCFHGAKRKPLLKQTDPLVKKHFMPYLQ